MLTSDGTHIVFASDATTLDTPDTNEAVRDIFVRHLEQGVNKTLLTNMDVNDQQGLGDSSNPDIFLGGRAVIYQTSSSTLWHPDQDSPYFARIPDNNNSIDVYETRVKGNFIRGDVDSSGAIDLTDALIILSCLFQGGVCPQCLDAAIFQDNDAIDVTTAIQLLAFEFQGGPPPWAPFPNCGFAPTNDVFSCRRARASCPGHSHD